ncbi:MAG: ATP-binding protein [Oligoflexia bacterium]|nr:ATP-binding protein [Oligoflexia bacterium]
MKLSSTKLVFLALAIFVGAIGAKANREEIVAGVNGGIPYLVVLEGEGPSTKKPGIYKRDLKNDWTLIIPGKVSVLDRIGGYIHQLAISNITKRADAFAVVNGKIHLFSADNERFTFGETIPVFVNKNSNPVSLPTITNGEDVAYYQELINNSGSGKKQQLVIFSIRSPNPMGSGITFATVFDVFNNENSQIQLKQVTRPTVLEWDFIDSVSLHRRIRTSPTAAFISKSLIHKYAQPRANEEAALLKTWRESLDKFYQNFDKELSSFSSTVLPVPYIDLVSNQIKIDRLPGFSFPAQAGKIHVVFDPMGDKSGAYASSSQYLSLDELRLSKPLIQAEIKIKNGTLEDGNVYKTKGINGNSYFASDKAGVLNLIFSDESGASAVQIQPLLKNGTQIQEAAYMLLDGPYLIVSWKFTDGSTQTDVFALKEQNGAIQIHDSLTVSVNYYTKEQLAQRVQRITVGSSGATLSLDDVTPLVTSNAEYVQLHKLSSPHIDLERSLKENAVIEFYPKAAEETSLVANVFYKSFDEKASGARRNGFYLDKNEEPKIITEILRPQLLSSPESKEEQQLTFENKKISESNNEYDVSEIAISFGDEVFQKGEKSFISYLLYSNRNSAQQEVVRLFTSNVPMASLEDVYTVFIKNDRFSSDHSHGLVLFYKVKDRGLFAQLVKIYPPKNREDKVKIEIPSETLTKPIVNADTKLTNDEIESRIKVDKSGAVYWVKTPELQFTDPDYRLFDISRSKTVDPNKETISLYSANKKDSVESHGASWKFLASTFSNYLSRKDGVLPNNPLSGQPVSAGSFKNDMFTEYKKMLDDLADPTKKARRTVLIVPDSLKEYALGYPLALFMRDQDKSKSWNSQTDKLKLYVVDTKHIKQEEVLKNLDSLRNAAQDNSIRPVLVGSLGQIMQYQRPQASDPSKAFSIEEEEVNKIGTDNAQARLTSTVPHFLYMLLTEGKHIGIDQFVKSQSTFIPRFSSILIGTQDEWDKLVENGTVEERVDIKSMFELTKLEAPSTETRENFVMEFFNRREIQALNYKINLNSFKGDKTSTFFTSEERAKRMLAEYFVNRADQLSHDNKESELSGFIRALNVFVGELQRNPILRSQRSIDRSTVEQVLAKVFPVVLNLDVLSEDDPLKRISHKNAAWQWQQAGYGGPLSLKQEVIKVIKSQLIPDSARSASSSFIVVGESGTGKTALFRSLFGNFLNLKEYNTTQTFEQNAGSWYFILSCQLIRDNGSDKKSQPGSITLEQALEHIENFLASPNGHRGFLIFDDLHLAPPKVRDVLISKIRYLLENTTIPINDGDVIPTRNITIGITLNFTNHNLLSKIAPNVYSPTVDHKILAALSHNDKLYDDSLLKRFGKTILLDLHPQDAKSPQLRKALVEATKNTFNNSKVLNFINSETINEITKQFPKADARTFTATSVANLVQLNQSKGQLIIVSPKLVIQQNETVETKKSETEVVHTSTEALQRQIESYIQNNFEVIPIDKTQRGKIEFLKYMADIVRKYSFETLLKAINEDPRFAGSVVGQQAIGAPSARAIFDHLENVPNFPIKELNLDPALMSAKSANEKNQFRRVLTAILQKQDLQNARLPKVANPPVANIFQEFAQSATPIVGNRTRQHVLKESYEKLSPVVAKIMAALLRVKDINQLPTAPQWLDMLDRSEPNLSQQFSAEMAQILSGYILEIADKELVENRREAASGAGHKLTQYDAARLFSMVLDKAVASMPWEHITMFMINNLEYTSRNLAHGHNPYLQHFLFESKYSAIKSIDASLVTGHAKAMPLFDNMGAPDPTQLNKSFNEKCASLLATSLTE